MRLVPIVNIVMGMFCFIESLGNCLKEWILQQEKQSIVVEGENGFSVLLRRRRRRRRREIVAQTIQPQVESETE